MINTRPLRSAGGKMMRLSNKGLHKEATAHTTAQSQIVACSPVATTNSSRVSRRPTNPPHSVHVPPESLKGATSDQSRRPQSRHACRRSNRTPDNAPQHMSDESRNADTSAMHHESPSTPSALTPLAREQRGQHCVFHQPCKRKRHEGESGSRHHVSVSFGRGFVLAGLPKLSGNPCVAPIFA